MAFWPFLTSYVAANPVPGTHNKRHKRTAEELLDEGIESVKMSEKEQIESLKVEIARQKAHLKALEALLFSLI